jgi:hypothetical protein
MVMSLLIRFPGLQNLVGNGTVFIFALTYYPPQFRIFIFFYYIKLRARRYTAFGGIKHFSGSCLG